MNKFSDLSLSSVVSSNLNRLGFLEPTPVQAQSIPPALAGRDVMATAQTGTGKTLAFVLPVIEALVNSARKPGIQALILSPTRELAIQIDKTFQLVASGTGFRSTVIVGGMNERPQLSDLRKGTAVAIATPGRLCDFLQRKLMKLDGVRMVILDEADRMLDMGFLPDIRRILSELPASRQTLFFSATIEPSVAHLIRTHLKDPVRISIDSTSRPAENVNLDLYEVEQDGKIGLLRSILHAEKGSVLVFARTKHGTDRLAQNLSRAGFDAARIHGNRTQNQRNQALRGFQNGDYRVLVATDVAARGIHVDGIAHVINYDLPQVPEDFIHRVGRTGRAGAHGIASTFATRSERKEISRIEKALSLRMQRRSVPSEVLSASLAALPLTTVRAKNPVSITRSGRTGRQPVSGSSYRTSQAGFTNSR